MSSHNGIHTWLSDCPACLLEPKPKGMFDAQSGTLTLEMLNAAVHRDRINNIRRIEAESEAYTKFLAEVPEEFREHPEIRGMAWLAAWSQTMPFHPKDREALARRYREIVSGN